MEQGKFVLTEMEKRFESNKGLVGHIMKKYYIRSDQYKDVYQEGLIGLWKACITFDDSKGTKFATYAGRCIQNQIGMFFRKEKKTALDTSIQYVLNNDNGDEFTVEDTIADERSSNFTQDFLDRESIAELISIILNCSEPRKRLFVLLTMAGMKQRQIGNLLGISQSYVSRLEKQYRRSLRKNLKSQSLHYEEVFKVTMKSDVIIITFSTSDVENFKSSFARFLLKMTDPAKASELTNFKLISTKEKATIYLPSDPESFALLASLVAEIDGFEMNYVNNQNMGDKGTEESNQELVEQVEVAETNDEVSDKGQEQGKEQQEEQADDAEDHEEDESDDSQEDVQTEKVKHATQQEMRAYIFSCQEFTLKEVMKNVKNVSSTNLRVLINTLLKKGKITRIDRGKYSVVKDQTK